MRVVSIGKIPTGLYHRGLVTYASPTSCRATIIAVILLLMFFGFKTSDLRNVNGVSIFKQNRVSFNETIEIPDDSIY